MEADAFDEYLRTRYNLLKSVIDGLDYDNAVADYFFSSLNLYRQGEDDFVKSWEDNVCDMILRGEWTQGMSDIIVKEEMTEAEKRLLLHLFSTNQLEHLFPLPSNLKERSKEMLRQREANRGKGLAIPRTKEEKKAIRQREKQEALIQGSKPVGDVNRWSEYLHDETHPWRNRIVEVPPMDIFSEEIQLMPPDSDGHFPTHHPHDKMHHPNKRMNAVTGFPYWVEKLRSFYLPSEPGEKPKAELWAEKERLQDKYWMKTNNPIVTGTAFKPSKKQIKEVKDQFNQVLSEVDEEGEYTQDALNLQSEINSIVEKNDKKINAAQALEQLVELEATKRNISNSEARQPYFGPHHDVSSHSLYLRDFERWCDENRDLVNEIEAQYPSPIRGEHAVKVAHFNSRAKDWLSDDAHSEPYIRDSEVEEVSDDIYADPETWGIEKPPKEAPIEMRKLLNYNGYRHGLEFLSPIERARVSDFLHEHGSLKGDKQKIDLGDGSFTSFGRIKRDLAQRTGHEIHHAIRGQEFHGPNIPNTVEGPHLHPKAEKAEDNTAHLAALHDVDHSSGGSMYDFILGELNNNLGLSKLPEEVLGEAKAVWEASLEDYYMEGEEPPPEPTLEDIDVPIPLEHLPNTKKGLKTKVEQRMKDEGLSYTEALIEELRSSQPSDGQHELSRKKLLELLGFDEDLEPKEQTALYHPSEPIITVEEMREIDEMAKEKADIGKRHKDIRGAHRVHSTGYNGPRKEDLPEDQHHLWPQDKETGQLLGMGSPFAEEFQINGGAAGSISRFIHFLHSQLPKIDGESIMGSELDSDINFTVNSENEGLYGLFATLIHDRIKPRDVTPGEIVSPFDVSSPRGFREGKATKAARTPKVNYTDHDVSFAAPSVMDVVGKGNAERGEMFEGHSMSKNNLTSKATGLGTNPMITASTSEILPASTQNSRNARRHAAIFGRMRPPHDAQEAKRLTMNHMKTGKHPFSFVVSKPSHWMGFQGRKKKKMIDDELLEYDDEYIDYDSLHSHLEETVSLKQELEERLEEQKERGFVDPKINNQISDAEEEIKSITRILIEAEKQEYTDEPLHGKLEKIHENIDAKDEADNNAHIEMARRLIKMIPPEQLPNPQENPAAFWALTSRALRDAGRMLRILPPQEGITTHSYRHQKTQALTSSQLSDDGVFDPHQLLGNTVKQLGQEVLPSSDVESVLESLGLPNDAPHVNMIERLIESIDGPVRVMKNADILNSSVATGVEFHQPDMRIRDENRNLIRPDYSLHGGEYVDDHHGALKEFNDEQVKLLGASKKGVRNRKAILQSRYENPLRYITEKLMKEKSGAVERNNLSHIPLTPIEMQLQSMTVFGNAHRGRKGSPNIKGVKNRIKSLMHDLIVSHGDLEEGQVSQGQEILSAGWGSVPVGPATSSNHHTVQDLWGPSSSLHFGYEGQSPFGWEHENGKPVLGTFTQPETYHSVPNETMKEIWGDEVADTFISTDWQPISTVNNETRANAMGETPHMDPMIKGEDIVVMMNPDLLFKEDEARPPPLLPMHRIFSLKDLEAFRGFTGDWVVSAYPEGKRLIITRDGDSISAYDSDAEDVRIGGASQQHLKKLTEKDFVVDAIKRGKSLYIFDILSYDGSNISDLSVPERLKVLRGQFDSYESAHIPAPDDTVVTDEGGLEGAVERLKEEHPRLLLRDGKSTYMKGERRHPKWFMLRKNKDIALIVLDVRGSGPFTYRLGAGPVDEDDLGNRGVEYEGATYLDVGTVKSPKPFEEGDIVRVSVSGVKAKRRGDKTIYDVTPNTIRAGSNIESPASLESLGLLAKSHPIIPVKYDLSIVDNVLTVSFDGIDDVLYKMEKTRNGFWAHSPEGALSPLMNTDYPILLAESIRPLWHDTASIFIAKKLERVRVMSNPKNREEAEEESAGIIEEDDDDNILKPERQKKMLDMLSRIADLTERIKKEKMTGGPGARGLGIDVGAQIESPRGPTELRSEQNLPDWDMLERPTEDPESEYPQARKKRRMLEQSGENEIEMRED